ncbi:MAG: tetratricopeptide repeat protein [Nitrospirae bacterium]|nr:tetratricopeptide repeat protein [Nitrospirota bacterium]
MGKNRLLDTCYKALGLALLTVLLSSCSMPRIIVLNDPLTPEEHINLGLSYERQGEYGPALEQYEIAGKKLPEAFLYKGNLYFLKGEYEKAEAAYEKAIKKSGDPRAYNNLAWLYFTMNKEMGKAEELAEKAVSLSPESEEFRNTLDEIRNRKTPD